MRVTLFFAAALAWAIGLTPIAPSPAAAQSASSPPAAPAAAQAATELLRGFSGSFIQIEQTVAALAATGDPRVEKLLEKLQAGELYVRKSDKTAVAVQEKGDGFALFDPLDGTALGETDRFALDKVKMNNRLRLAVAGAIGALKLANPDPDARSKAAEAVFRSRDADALPLLDAAIAKESDRKVKIAMERARAAILLGDAAADKAKRVDAAKLLGSLTDRDALPLLAQAANEPDADVAAAATAGAKSIQASLAVWDGVQNVYYGISLGSVLLLAAIGLAVTFGVMGVINMAHGEMVMIGAYAAYLTQQALRLYAPGLADWSVLIAIPTAFATAFLVGVILERAIIRHLYGRPLETLLATFGVSLVLQQAVRSLFGPTNREVSAPSWMSGAVDLGGLLLTYNRLWIIAFAMIAFIALVALIRFSRFGLFVRAVVQNRAMAGSMGVRTDRIDAVTFGLGSGVAGIAGVALSQIDNVSPNLGQSYIIDSFMVVVFGGVGNLWGTLVGALTLGIANKLLEPYAGAVLGKILLLVFIILFIQKRPRGLFALKGRAVEQ